jgi:outer membrane protein assembly factor BamA/autotransporter translocation and assembly factor TamB
VALRFSHLVMAVNWRKVAKRTAAAFLLLITGGAILIHLSPVQQFLLRRAENYGRASGYPFTAKRVQLRPFDLEMSLDGFAYDNLGVKVEIDRVTLDVPWNVYTSKGISIKTFEADGMRIKIASPEPLVPEPSGETTAIPRLDVEHLAIRNASLSYENQATRLDIPSFSIEAINKRGVLKLGAPITMSPDTILTIPEVPLVLSSDSLQIERTKWAANYGPRMGSGSAIGTLRWAPTVAASLTFDTEPLAIEKWDNVVAQGKILYENGVLNVTDFNATRGKGQVTGSAKITDQNKSAKLLWNGVALDPSGVRGVTGGELDLQWKASDLNDVSGTGRITVTTPEYGKVDGNVRLAQGRANLDLRGAAMGAAIQANINTGMDRKLAGTFLVTHRQYGLITARGNLRGTLTAPLVDARVAANQVTYQGIGPIDGTAQATYRDQVVSLTQLAAQLKNTTIPSGEVQVNLKTRALNGTIPEIHAELGDFLADGAGKIEGTAMLSGSIDHPVAALTASSSGLDIGATHIDSVEASAGLNDNVLHVTQLVARQKDGMLEATGDVNLETEQTLAQVHVSNLQLTEVRGLSTTANFDADVSGSYKAPSANLKGDFSNVVYEGQDHGNIAVNGTADTQTLNLKLQSAKYNASVDGVVQLRSPYAYTATLDATASPVEYQQYQAVANGRIRAEGTATPAVVNMLQLEGFTLIGEGINLKANGALDSGVKVDVAANLAQLPVQNVVLGGEAQIAAVVRGPIDNPQIDGDLTTANATIRTTQMPDAATVVAAVGFNQDQFTIREMHANYADARVAIEGAGTIKGTGDFTFKAENIRPERIMPDRQLAGIVGLEGQVKVNAPRLDSIEGQAKVTQLELTAHDIEVHQVQPGEISFANQVLSVRNFELQGPETKALASGTADFGTGNLNFDIQANTDLRILEGFIPNSAAFGRIESQVAVRGTTTQPDMRGFVNINDAEIQTAEPPLVLSGVNARIQLSGSQLQIAQATGDLNGGSFTITGGAGVSSSGLRNAAVHVDLMKTQLEYPEGLQSEVTANLALNGTSPNLELTGNVTILDGLYREDINLEATVFEQLTPPEAMAFVRRDRSTIADAISLDVSVNTMSPVTVSNNVADLDLIGNFQVRGTVGEPVVLGRAEALEGGEVYAGLTRGGEAAAVGERRDRYIIQRGIVDFNNSLRTEPTVDIEAVHDLNAKGTNYLVTLRATGTPTNLRTELTSDPFEEESDIQAMLLTGRTSRELQQQSAIVDVARESAIDYLSGKLTSHFFQNAGAALGLDTVTIEPASLAAEQDVSARLTVGKDITNNLGFVYSQNLAGGRDPSWIVNYSTFKNFVVRGINRPDQDEIRVELRHGLEFGGGPALPRRVAPRDEVKLNEVTFTGSAFPVEELRKHVAKEGKPYSITRMNDDVRSLREFLAENQFVDARVRARRTVSGSMVDVAFSVEDGPKIAFDYRGAPVSDSAKKEISQIWMDSLAEAASLKESIAFLLREVRDDGYLQAKVSAKNEATDPNERLFVFQIELGMRFDDPKWVFQGADPLVNVTKSAGTILEKPEVVRDQIEYELRAQGFLDAKSTVPALVMEKDGPRFVVSVDKGLQYVVSAIHYSGNAFFKDEHLTLAAILGPTSVIPADEVGATRPPEAEKQLKPFPYTSDWVSTARRRIMTEYWQQGFNDVQIAASTKYVPESGKIEVTLDIKEGVRQEIAGIQIFGDNKTVLNHIRRYFRFSQGDPVDYGRINLTRKKLYDTGLFKRVDIQVSGEPQGYVARVNLNERAPWSVKYGITLTDHQSHNSVGLSTEVTHRNLFGKGILAGTSLKWDRTFREARLFNSFPVFMNRDVTTTSSMFRTRETLDDIVSNTWGATLQQQWRLSDFYMLTYDYTLRRVSSFERDLSKDDPDILDGIVRVARLNATLSRDTRDDILNATRGTFFSNSFDLAPPGIGSSIRYFRNYTQYLRFREVRKNLIWASAYRLGMARAFGGGTLVPTDQFRAGGSTSLRAFSSDNSALEPGNALILTNQELRFPVFWRIGGVGFLDVGNVYDRVGATKVFQQRYSPGFGIRINTPIVLIRMDVGVNLWPRTGEDRKTISFGIGQAF